MSSIDCTFNTSEGKFNFRVGAYIKNGSRILMVRNPQEPPNIWYSVGGRVRFGETLQQAVLRELEEETGFRCETEHLAAIHENFFNASNGFFFHEFSAFFTVKITDELRSIKTGQLTKGGPVGEYLEWIDLKECEGKTIYPEFFKEENFGKGQETLHFVSPVT